jgi:two-component system sensor histidine kinase and response regulator WspE
MNQMDTTDLSDLPLLELFRMEVEVQGAALTEGLLGLEKDADSSSGLRGLMRAAHSVKGAARIVGSRAGVRVAHAMEDCFVAAQSAGSSLSGERIDALLRGVDLINRIANSSDEGTQGWQAKQYEEISAFIASLTAVTGAPQKLPVAAEPKPPEVNSAPPELPAAGANVKPSAPRSQKLPVAAEPKPMEVISAPAEPLVNPREVAAIAPSPEDRALRVTAGNLNNLMGLAGEALMASRWLDEFAADLLRLKQFQRQLGQSLESLGESIRGVALDERTSENLTDLRDRTGICQGSLAKRMAELELFDHRFVSFSTRLYHEVLECRMRPFADGIQGFRRMVRDVSQSLGKNVQLEIQGDATHVDRDILERLKAPLDHLLRNAIDHGIEAPADRLKRGKPESGTVQLQACHSAGMLLVTVTDDGRGIDPEAVRLAIVRKKLTTPETAGKMTGAELMEFLFLPGFTMKESVSEISGRGVGLDVVQTMVKEVGGQVRVSSAGEGAGTRFQLELPLTLSLIRTLLVEIGGEPYAFPLARVERALKLSRDRIESVQGRQHFTMGAIQVGLVAAHQLLGVEHIPSPEGEVSVVILSDKTDHYGLVIDRFLGERELVVRTLDARLGKVKNISSAALMPDGSPVLIFDVDDLKRSIVNLLSGERLSRVEPEKDSRRAQSRKRVLVVDDSVTVRELERKLLTAGGYAVDVAVDGMDGWNAARAGTYDLIVSDVDMPRLDGIEFLKLIRADHRLKSLPVMIVSYKDSAKDRSRGMEAGADYYLTKASFHDETLLRVVTDLIGKADS